MLVDMGFLALGVLCGGIVGFYCGVTIGWSK